MIGFIFMIFAVAQLVISCLSKADNMALMNLIFFIGVAIFDKLDDINWSCKKLIEEVKRHAK